MKSSVYKYYILLVLCLSFPASLLAQELEEEVQYESMEPEEHAFIIDAQVRARGEYRNGAITPLVESRKPAFFVNERARVSLGYASNGLQLQISGQHAGVWGNQGLGGNGNAFDLHEAWGQVNTKNRRFAARIGRQELSYDNGRILGSNDWSAQGNSHDALRLSYEDDLFKVHLIGSFSQNDERLFGTFYADSLTNLYKNMEAIWFHVGNNSFPLQGSILLMNAGYETGGQYIEEMRHVQTMGGIINFNKPKFGFSIEGYYQMGKADRVFDVKAWMAALNVRYTPVNCFTAKAGYDYISGSKIKATKNTSFCSYYGSYHEFNGAMDFFSVLYQRPFSAGLSDAHVELKWNAVRNVHINGEYHFFSASADQTQLAHELDLNVNWHIKKDIVLSAGYSGAMLTKNMKLLFGNIDLIRTWQDYGFIQLNISPRILFHKW